MGFPHLEVRIEDCTGNIHWSVPMYYSTIPSGMLKYHQEYEVTVAAGAEIQLAKWIQQPE